MPDAAAAAVRAIADAGAGVAIGIGDALGVPRTDETECEKARREGRYLDASTACSAGTYLGYVGAGALDYVNPTSTGNAAYGTVNWMGGKLTGENDWTLGTKLYDWLH